MGIPAVRHTDGQMRAAKEKKDMRLRMREKRNGIPEDERRKKDEQLRRQLLLLPFYRQTETLLVYVSMKSEADTRGLIQHAIADGKKVAVPKCFPGRKMEFYLIGSMDELSPGTMGIFEPDPERSIKFDGETGLLIVPGLAFDKRGARLGYGGGYYDNYMGEHPGLKTIGYFYSMQEVDYVPAQPHDRYLKYVLTENGPVKLTGCAGQKDGKADDVTQ